MRKTAIKKDKRTRIQKNFQQTVLKLYRKKTLDEITINEVCDKVGVPRSSFYYHYNTIRDVIEEIEKDFIKEMNAVFGEIREEHLEGKELFLKLYERGLPVIKANEQFVRAILVERQDYSFVNKWGELLKEYLVFNPYDELKAKAYAHVYIFSIGDMLAAGVPMTKDKAEMIYEGAEHSYALKKSLLNL